MSTQLTIVPKNAVLPPLKWFNFRQNNSGGSFYYDENVAKEVYVQAPSSDLADEIAQTKGIYFNGVAEGCDCECCGDRWYGSSSVEAEFPMEMVNVKVGGKYEWVYRDYAMIDSIKGMTKGYAVFHFYDGTRQYGVVQLQDDETNAFDW